MTNPYESAADWNRQSLPGTLMQRKKGPQQHRGRHDSDSVESLEA